MKPKNDTWALLLFNYESLIAEENLIRFLPAGDGGGDPTDLFINSDAEEKRHRKAHEETSEQDDHFLRLCLWEGTALGGRGPLRVTCPGSAGSGAKVAMLLLEMPPVLGDRRHTPKLQKKTLGAGQVAQWARTLAIPAYEPESGSQHPHK